MANKRPFWERFGMTLDEWCDLYHLTYGTYGPPIKMSYLTTMLHKIADPRAVKRICNTTEFA